MGKVAFLNSKNHAVHIGNKTIMPNQTREVEESDIPGFKPEQAEETIEVSEILKLLDQTVPNFINVIQARHEDGTQHITNKELDELEEAENNGKTRVGVISAITEERLTRSKEDMRQGELIKYRESISEMDEDMLMKELELQKDNADFLAIVNEVIEALKPAE